jgi:4-amino-4-deoxy-L-arabinose transferase-like glycosyltransferase
MAPWRYWRLRSALRDPSGRARWLIVVGLTALVVRVLYVLVVLRDYSPVSDALHYHTLAAQVGEGRGMVHDFPFGFPHLTAFRPPLYPLLLGAVYAVTGPRLGVAEALNVTLGVGVVVLATLVSWRLAGWKAGVATGLVAAVYPPLIFNDGPPLSEPLGLLILLATVLLLLDGRAAGAGVTSGLLVLTRPSAQVFVIVLTGWVLWRLGWRRAVSYVAIMAVVLAPWVLRNWVRLGTPVVVTSNGFNLNAIYSPEAKASGGFVDGFFDPRFARLRAGITNEAELDAVFMRHALASLREDPMHVMRIARGGLQNILEPRPGRNDVAEANDGRNLRLQHLSVPVAWYVLLAGTAGLWTLRRRPGVGPLVLAAVVFPALSIVTVATPRQRVPLDIACCIGVGGLAAELARRREARQLSLAGEVGSTRPTARRLGGAPGATPRWQGSPR